MKTYYISGMVQLWRQEDTIELTNYNIRANSKHQALLFASQKIAIKQKLIQKSFYQRMLNSKLIISETKILFNTLSFS